GVLPAVALTAAVGAPVSVSSAAPVARAITAGSMGVQLLEVPLSAYGDRRARLYIIDHLHPGTINHRRIEISNTTASSLHIVMYPAAAAIRQGAFVGAAAHTPNELSTWTSVLPGASNVPPGGHAIATVTIAVPRDAPSGEQYGVVWAETRSSSPAGGGITRVSRVGIRLYLSSGPGGAPASKFTIDSLTGKRSPDGQPEVLASVHNTGGRALDMSGTLQLSSGPGGLSAGPFPGDPGHHRGDGRHRADHDRSRQTDTRRPVARVSHAPQRADRTQRTRHHQLPGNRDTSPNAPPHRRPRRRPRHPPAGWHRHGARHAEASQSATSRPVWAVSAAGPRRCGRPRPARGPAVGPARARRSACTPEDPGPVVAPGACCLCHERVVRSTSGVFVRDDAGPRYRGRPA